MTMPNLDQPITLAAMAQFNQVLHRQISMEIQAAIEDMDRRRQHIEDMRSQRRNRNRVLMIAVAWVASIVVPIFALTVLHSTMLATGAGSVGYTGDLIVTGYAWLKRY